MNPADRLTLDDVFRAMDKAQVQLEQERRSKFGAFGISDDCQWPGSRLFHAHSSLGPWWRPALTIDEVDRHTRNLHYRRYPGAHLVALPPPSPVKTSLEESIISRRSVSEFSSKPLQLSGLSTLLSLGAGVTCWQEIPRRAAPSGGALYPIEIYAIALTVDGLESAIYHYLPLDGVLERLRPIRPDVGRGFLPPGLYEARPAVIIALSAVFERTQAKYLERGYRFALLEAGHMAQNLLLIATALGLNAVPVGGYWDEPFNAALNLDVNEEAVVYAILVGEAPSSQPEQRVAAIQDRRIGGDKGPDESVQSHNDRGADMEDPCE